MAVYQYIAKKLDGTKVKGQVHALDEDQVYSQLKAHGLYLLEVREEKVKTYTKPLSSKSLEIFTRELSVMLGAGIPLSQSLNMLWQQERSSCSQAVYQKLYASTAEGNCFSEAMKLQEGVFPLMMIQMVKAGEESSQLNLCMDKLAEYYEKDARLMRQLLTALAYPLFLFGMTMVSILVIFTVVLPNFFNLFETMEYLPFSTKMLIGLSNMLIHNPLSIVMFLTAGLAVMIYLYQNDRTGVVIDRLLLNLPVAGTLFRVIATAKFARSLGFLYTSGAPMLRAVSIASSLLGNRYLAVQFEPVLHALQEGCALSTVLSSVNGLDARLITAVYLGEESGELGTMLNHISDSFENISQESSKQLAALAEPVMIVFLAFIIGCVMLSVMVPIYQYYQILG